MAKFNKYWGFVAIGAATAAAAGAVAAIITKKNRTESIGFEDDFDDDFDDFDIPEKSDEKETAEDFVAWEDTEEECTDCCKAAEECEECDCEDCDAEEEAVEEESEELEVETLDELPESEEN